MNQKQTIAIFGILLLFAGFGAGTYFTKFTTKEISPQSQITEHKLQQIGRQSNLVRQQIVIADVAEAVLPSVVNISSEKIVETTAFNQLGPFQNDPFFRQFFGGQLQVPNQKRKEKSLGSGVIVSVDGIILTNNHVIEKANKIQVSLSDGREVEAEIIGTDPDSDVGILKLKEKIDDLKPLKFGDSANLRLGEVVLAVGNPFGVGQTVTMGIVSAKGRANVGIVEYEDFIQTDAAINPGNSGGALVNLKGELVGINTAILSRSGGYQGIGFAIPSNMAEPIMNSLLKTGQVDRGWLGIGIQDIDQNLAQALALKSTKGVLVTQVMDGTPAKDGGLQQGDIIVSINGKATINTAKLRNIIANAGAKNNVEIKILRRQKEKTLSIKLGEKPRDEVAEKSGPSVKNIDGLKLSKITPALRNRFRIPSNIRGLIILQSTSVTKGAGFRVGDVIQTVNGHRVNSIAQWKKSVARKGTKNAVLIWRQGNSIFLVYSLP